MSFTDEVRLLIEEECEKERADLTGVCLADAAAVTFLRRALRKNESITELSLGMCQIGRAGIRALTRTLNGNSTLKKLWLHGNAMGDEGAEDAATLLNNSALEFLSVSSNDFGPKGAAAFGTALATNTKCLDLSLSYNSIGHDGGKEIAAGLRENETLKVLRLSGCGLNERAAGALFFAEALRANSTLLHLLLEGNGIDDLGPNKIAIDECLSENKAAPTEAEQRARCLIFCAKLCATATPSIGSLNLSVLRQAVDISAAIRSPRRAHAKDWPQASPYSRAISAGEQMDVLRKAVGHLQEQLKENDVQLSAVEKKVPDNTMEPTHKRRK